MNRYKTFPLQNNSKIPTVKWKDYKEDMSLDNGEKTGYGINCGESNLVVIDVDAHGDTNGMDAWQGIINDHPELEKTFIVQTPNDGLHYYFKYDHTTTPIKNSASKISKGIDVRGSGGYVVAPKSKVKDGDGTVKEYKILNNVEPIELPQYLIDLIKKTTKNEASKKDSKSVIKELNDKQTKLLGESIVELAKAEEGKRNDTLNRILFRLMCNDFTPEILEDRFKLMSMGIGLSENEFNKTLDSVIKGYEESERLRIAKEKEGEENDSVRESESAFDGSDKYYSDAVMSKRFGEYIYNKHWLYLNGKETWMRYNEETGQWLKTSKEEIISECREWCFNEVKVAFESMDTDKVKASKRCLNKITIANVAELARVDCLIDEKEFNKNPDLLLVENGVVNLQNKELLPFSHEYLITNRIPIPFDDKVRSKYVDIILSALPDDAVDWFMVMAGQALTGHQPSEDTMIFFNGVGANGKSTLLNILGITAGSYCGFPPQDSLIRTKSNDAYNLMCFKNIHQAIIEEMPDKQLDTVRMKNLTGTEEVTGRGLYKDFETFKLKCTIFVSCNILPQVTDYDNGTWRRIVLVPFTKVFKRSSKAITNDSHHLADDGVRKASLHNRETHIDFLARRIEGAYQWYKSGMRDPELPDSIIEATEEWQNRGDNIKNWCNAYLEKDESSYVLMEDLRDSHNYYLNSHGYSELAYKNFLDRFTTHRIFRDLKLTVNRGRVGKLIHSQWTDPKQKNNPNYSPRTPGGTPTHIKGIKFKDFI